MLIGLASAASAFSESKVTEIPLPGPSCDFSRGPLKVSSNHRFLQYQDGTPFFYLGDTAWELFHRLDREEAEKYLENRRQKGMTVIQAVVLAELDGLNDPNPYGDRPLIGNDPAKPNENYFKHVDFIVETAEKKGLFIGMLPTWGDKVNKAWGVGPVIFNPENAEVYGRFLGERYKNHPNIIWILGGDRVPEGTVEVWRSMAKGIKSAGDEHLFTFHPQGWRSSSEWFHSDDWLDFNMIQSGHSQYDNPNYKMIQRDYERKPVKPCLDGEPCYEDHPVNWKPENGWFDDYDVRKACYWGLFAGGCGSTYGCHDIWQMKKPEKQPISSARNTWYDVLDLPGAYDMMHARHLMLSRPYFSRVPDQSLISGDEGDGTRHIQATRGENYAFIYIPFGQNVEINMGKISGDQCMAWWFDPRTGAAKRIGSVKNEGKAQFDPPGEPGKDKDWILVLDDQESHFSEPGRY
ncbi:MAG: DUF4038 domain-containing protein [bacterium]|nr:DUF4038 domain-containing protein [bacterium]